MKLNNNLISQDTIVFQIEAKDYPTIKCTVDMKKKTVNITSDNTANSGNTNQPSPANPATKPLPDFAPAFSKEKNFWEVEYKLQLFMNGATNDTYLKAITDIDVDGQALVKDVQFKVRPNDGYISLLKLGDDLLKKDVLVFSIKAKDYPTIKCTVNVKTNKVDIVSDNTANNEGNNSGSGNSQGTTPSAPTFPFTPTLTEKPDQWLPTRNYYILTLNSSSNESPKSFIDAVKLVKINDDKELEKASYLSTGKYMLDATKGSIEFMLPDGVSGTEPITLTVESGEKTVVFELDLTTMTAKLK